MRPNVKLRNYVKILPWRLFWIIFLCFAKLRKERPQPSPPHPFLQFYFQAISNFKIKLPKQRFEMKVIFLLFELLVLSSCQRFSRKTPMSCSPKRCRWTDQPVTVHFRFLYFIWGYIKETIFISVITYFISFIQKIFKINVKGKVLWAKKNAKQFAQLAR